MIYIFMIIYISAPGSCSTIKAEKFHKELTVDFKTSKMFKLVVALTLVAVALGASKLYKNEILIEDC